MQTYQVFIDDDRYSVATLEVIFEKDRTRAREWAETAMRTSAHHLGVEVFQSGARLFGVGSLSQVNHQARTGVVVGF